MCFADGEAGCGWSHRAGGGHGPPAAWLRARWPAPRHSDRAGAALGKAPEAAGEPKSVSGCAYNGQDSAPEPARALEHLWNGADPAFSPGLTRTRRHPYLAPNHAGAALVVLGTGRGKFGAQERRVKLRETAGSVPLPVARDPAAKVWSRSATRTLAAVVSACTLSRLREGLERPETGPPWRSRRAARPDPRPPGRW